ncbi:STAS/SEC14 domain-containing protein [Hymenobacter cellulosilyticus]|uniref:STAS/SEC14 domain-containing protein n=1 Tax=Hymenobacter cellulosilyticus TaxID=2932248 RepID=A0A8T9QFA4_9BACT|nr:STAS/SEC14 domain-containing protein [Hymenobacter cellulosilyticus]UOQ74848.1 hypothetical protein MUN79_13835 [Hymenobacter cellulosilyticus]
MVFPYIGVPTSPDSWMEILYDTPSLSISYDELNQWLYVEWKGQHNEVSAVTGGDLVLRLLQQYPCTKMLNDNSQVTSDWDKGAAWVGGHYYDQLASQGVRFVAWVYPPHWRARKSMDKAMQFVTRPMVVTFDDLATAYEWLRTTF